PALATVGFLQRHKKGVIIEPDRVSTLEAIKGLFERRGAARLKTLPRLGENAVLERDDGAVVDALGREASAGEIGRLQESVLHQQLRADEVGIAREGGEALIGGVAVAGGTERQDLPPLLARPRQGIHPSTCGRTQVADAVRSGQRRGVQQYARRPRALGLCTVA